MRPRLLISRVLLMAVLTIALSVIWPWVGDLYGRAFRTSTSELFRTVSNRWEVEIMPMANPRTKLDNVMRLYNREAGQKAEQEFSVRYIAYTPTAFLFALIIATPLPWNRRLAALLWGFLWINIWIALCMLVLVVYGYSRGNAMAIYDVSPWVRASIVVLRETVVKAPVIKYTVPAVIWILVTFRRSDWKRFLGSLTGEDSSQDASDALAPKGEHRST